MLLYFRAVLFDHLLRDHTFHMGQPDNLGNVDASLGLLLCVKCFGLSRSSMAVSNTLHVFVRELLVRLTQSI